MSGAGGRITLTRLVPNGKRVAKGDLLVEFDRTALLDEERDAKALLNDLSHQLEEKRAQVSERGRQTSRRSCVKPRPTSKRRSSSLRKGPVLSEIDRLKNEAKADYAAPARSPASTNRARYRRLSEAGSGEGPRTEAQTGSASISSAFRPTSSAS